MRIYLTYIYIYIHKLILPSEIKFLPKYIKCIKLLTTRRNYEPYQRKYITRDSSNAAPPSSPSIPQIKEPPPPRIREERMAEINCRDAPNRRKKPREGSNQL